MKPPPKKVYWKPSTRLYIKESPGSPFPYYGKNGKWTQFRCEAKEYTQEDMHAETRWKLPNERWVLIRD